MADQLNCTGEISSISAIILGILNSVSGLAAIIGNVIVLMTFYKNQTLRQPCYYLVASLSAIDLFVGLAVNPLYILLTNVVSWQYREEHLLQLESFFAMSTSMVIMHNLSVMSIERYIAVIYPLRYYGIVTVKRSYIAIGIVWLFGFTLNAFSFALSNEDLPKLWIICGVLTGFVPMVIIFVCYGKILKTAREQSRRIAVTETSVSAISRDDESAVNGAETTTTPAVEAKRAKKTAWTVAIVVLVAVVMSMPVSVVSILQIATSDLCRRRHYNRAWMWAATLSLTSSAMDPWIYAMRIREFRASFKRTLCIK
ncbi:trace amine-associated receptor 9-like [Oculina patagonica]